MEVRGIKPIWWFKELSFRLWANFDIARTVEECERALHRVAMKDERYKWLKSFSKPVEFVLPG